MDVSLSPLVALLLVALLSRLILVLATRTTKGGSPSSGDDDGRRRLPPSPPGLPLLGHLPLLLGSLPHRRLQAMTASHGPVVLLRMGRVPTVVASSAAAAQEVMKARDLAYASRPSLRMAERLLYGRDMAFAPYGEHWRQARRVSVLHLLSHRRVLSFRRAREQEAAAMVARVSRARAAVNLNAALISYSSGIISRAALGVADVRTYGLDGGGGAAGENLTKLFDDFEALLGTVTVGSCCRGWRGSTR
ncbi:Cytochrome P450 71A25 [Zea mays]|uniref:Cytochrome P450 71A25 n=1 Tax=Zea mays TaxID=4577 RepID=A0A3L6EHU1_MAIZE|nr:Cytochrome P450 71A25 [Zea mays]